MHQSKRHGLTLFLLLALLLLPACSLLNGDSESVEATETASIPTAAATPTPVDTPEVTPSPVVQPPTVLNVWLVNGIAPDESTPAGQLLAEQLAAFDDTHPELTLNVEVKVPTGQGGTLSYLRTGRGVAPSILPDLVLLPADQLVGAAAEQLIFPLDDLLETEMVDDLYPAAETMSRSGENVVGYPHTLTGLKHLAFNSAAITATFPITWDGMLSLDKASFVFPAAGTPGAELALQLYLASGGSLAGESGERMLEVEPLTNALSAISRGRTAGVIPSSSANLTSLAEAWQLYVNSSANIVQTDVDLYLTNRTDAPDATFAAVPGLDQRLPALVEGTAWAISTPDPARQALASELLSWLASSANQGAWSAAAGELPARRSAFSEWPADDPYTTFLQSELGRAQPLPASADAALLSTLSTAVFDVVSLGKPPQQAAQEASEALQP